MIHDLHQLDVACQRKVGKRCSRAGREKAGRAWRTGRDGEGRIQKGRETEEEVVRVRPFVVPFALSFGFVHSSFSVVAVLCFMAAGASRARPREKRVGRVVAARKRGGRGLKGKAEERGAA